MPQLPVTRFDLLLVFGYTFGAFLLVRSVLNRQEGAKVRGVLVIPAVAGLVLIVSLGVLYSFETVDALPRLFGRARSSALTVAALVGAIAVGETVFNNASRLALAVLEQLQGRVALLAAAARWLPDLARGPFVGVPVAFILAISSQLYVETDVSVDAEETFRLPGAPTALAFRGEQDGYLALGEGQILHFDLEESGNGKLAYEVVAEDIWYPHGMAVVGNTLYVTHQGPLECRDLSQQGAFQSIRCFRLPGMSRRDSQIVILTNTRGGVLAFDIQPDGSLSNRREVVSDLPVSIGDHGVNAVVPGPDGRLYVSIGSLDRLALEPDMEEILASIDRPHKDLIGTIISFKPDGSDLRVFARGIRNIYDLAFDSRGRLYGVDNDGPTRRSSRMEEVLQIKPGAYYGYPYEGTFEPDSQRTDRPIWIADTRASAGIEWAERVGLGPGLIMGSMNRLTLLRLTEDERGVFVKDGTVDVKVLLEPTGFITAVEAGPDGRLWVGVFGFRQDAHALHVLRVEE